MAPIVILGILRRVFWTQTSLNPREKRKRRPTQSRTSGGMGFFSNDGPSTISTADGQPKENRCQFNKVILRNAERVNDIRCLSKQREENSTRTTGDFDSRTQCQSPGWPRVAIQLHLASSVAMDDRLCETRLLAGQGDLYCGLYSTWQRAAWPGASCRRARMFAYQWPCFINIRRKRLHCSPGNFCERLIFVLFVNSSNL